MVTNMLEKITEFLDNKGINDEKKNAKSLNFKLFHSRTTVRTFHFGSVFLFNGFRYV